MHSRGFGIVPTAPLHRLGFRAFSSLIWLLPLCIGAGCADRQQVASNWLDRFRALRPGFNAENVQIEVSLVRQQLGDPYLNHDLWDMVDEQALPLDQKPVLAANGFRVGTVGGTVPGELQNLLTHEPKDAGIRLASKTEGNGASARRLTIKVGHPYFLPLGPADRPATLKVARNGQQSRLELEKTQFGVFIQPAVSPDGETVLRFEPAVRHGDNNLMPKPTEDRSDWTLLTTRPEERFPSLGWEITLPPNEYLIVGGLVQQPGTLGHYSFVQDDMRSPGQWLLVVRSCRPQQVSAHHYSPVAQADGEPQSAKKRGPLPLALQSLLPRNQPAPQVRPPADSKVRAKSP